MGEVWVCEVCGGYVGRGVWVVYRMCIQMKYGTLYVGMDTSLDSAVQKRTGL